MSDTRTRAQQNRAIRQEALRESLAAGGHLEHVVEMIAKIADVDNELEASDISRFKIAAELKLRLIAKYLPDVKQVELQAEHTGTIATNLSVQYVDSSSD